MAKRKELTVPLYLKGNMLDSYYRLKEKTEEIGKSMSEVMRRGMECVALEEECKLQISPAAYFALQDCDIGALVRTHLSDGTMLISVNEEAYITKYESKVKKFLMNNKKGEK